MSHTNATASDVQALLDTDLTTSEIDAFLTGAKRWVTDNLEGEGVANATMTEIEKYLGAAFATSRDPRLKEAERDEVRDVYQRDEAQSEYLKIAIMLDPTGKLEEEFGGRRTVKFRMGAGYDDDLDLPATP